MVVSIDPAFAPVSGSLRPVVAELAAHGALFDVFARRQLAALSGVRAELEARERELDQRSAELASKEQRLVRMNEAIEQGAKRVEHDARRLAEAQQQWSQLKATAAGTSGSRRKQAAGNTRGEAVPQRDDLPQQLAAARVQLARMSAISEELNVTRRAAEKLQKRYLRQNARLARIQSQHEAERRDAVAQAGRTAERLRSELAQAQQRASELEAQLVQQRAEAAAQRQNWLAELRRLRQVLQCLADSAPGSLSLGADITATDEVIEGVLAECAALQHELAGGQESRHLKEQAI